MSSPKSLLTTLALVGFLIIAGCGGSSKPFAAKQWDHLSEQKFCEAFPTDGCRGAFGFTIDNQGNVVDGPAPDGKLIRNKLSADELSNLNSAVNAYVATVTGSSHCSPGLQGERLSIIFSDQTTHNVFTFRSSSSGSELCIAGDQDSLNRLEVIINQLLAKYYPVPFSSG